ncbi:hypothetical protein JMN32_02530 [Fulvivirga sp. 29W222]|uniref:Uncharacterized protein n=1 Tax=Fulvivirga marina TaxID=2494733 RepID=A0A937FV91_9BACT|nr:hypothetical protein [Fulvivirga marina]MBL6445167.1 hypothetical protein [Fulvivirga marina]
MHPDKESDLLMNKVELIMESPTERSKYKNMHSEDDRLAFFCNHFIMDDMSVRLMKRRYLLSKQHREAFIQSVDDIIEKLER